MEVSETQCKPQNKHPESWSKWGKLLILRNISQQEESSQVKKILENVKPNIPTPAGCVCVFTVCVWRTVRSNRWLKINSSAIVTTVTITKEQMEHGHWIHSYKCYGTTLIRNMKKYKCTWKKLMLIHEWEMNSFQFVSGSLCQG